MARDCCVGKFAGLISRRGEPRDTAKRRVAQLTRSFPGASTRGSSRLLRAAKGRAASPSQGKRPLIKLSRPTLASRFFIGSGRRMSGRWCEIDAIIRGGNVDYTEGMGVGSIKIPGEPRSAGNVAVTVSSWSSGARRLCDRGRNGFDGRTEGIPWDPRENVFLNSGRNGG